MFLRKIKDTFRDTLVYQLYSFFKYKLYPYKLKRAGVCAVKPNNMSIREETIDDKRLIISLTSFPARMKYLHKGLYSLMNQDFKPNMIILWLSKEQFTNIKIPDEVLELKKYGLTIRYVDGDIRSYKKLIPALHEFPNDIIVTADDDLYYPTDWLRKLVEAYRRNPKSIHCHMITRLYIKNGYIHAIKRKKTMKDTFSYFNKILGVSGILYPPHSLSQEVMNENVFLKIAPTSDDVWFWAMAVINRTKIHWIPNGMKELYYIENTQESTPCLTKVNDQGERLFEKHINAVITQYNISKILYGELNQK